MDRKSRISLLPKRPCLQPSSCIRGHTFLNEVELVPVGSLQNSANHRSSPSQIMSSRSSPSSLNLEPDPTIFSVQIKASPTISHQLNQQSSANTLQHNKIINFKAISSNDRILWTKNLTKAISNYSEKLLIYKNMSPKASNMRFSLPSAIAGRLLVSVVEASGLTPSIPNKSYMSCSFIASIGPSSVDQKDHLQIEESPIIKCSIPIDAHHYQQSTSSLTSLNHDHLIPFSAKFNQTTRFILLDDKSQQNSLMISLYEKDPFAPDRLLGSINLTLNEIKHDLKTSNQRPLVKQMNLMINNQIVIINKSVNKTSSSQNRGSISSLTSSSHRNSTGNHLMMTPYVIIKVDLLNSAVE